MCFLKPYEYPLLRSFGIYIMMECLETIKFRTFRKDNKAYPALLMSKPCNTVPWCMPTMIKKVMRIPNVNQKRCFFFQLFQAEMPAFYY